MANREHETHAVGRGPSDAAWELRYNTARDLLDETRGLLSLLAATERMAAVRAAGLAPSAAILSPTTLGEARRVGVLAGSFNPLTKAHIALAESARAVAHLDLVIWLHAVVTVDKEDAKPALLPDRLAHLLAYARSVPGNAVAICSHGLYVDEAAALHEHLPLDAELYLLVGFDKIVQIFDTRYYTDRELALAELFNAQRANLLVGPRATSSANDLAHLLAQPENKPYASYVTPIPLAPQYAADSSTVVRQLAAAPAVNRSRLRALVPPEALALILETSAYRTPGQYLLRQQWLAALAAQQREKPPLAHAPISTPALPPLSSVVRATAATTEQAEAVRAWLALPPPERDATPARQMLAQLGFRI